MSTRTSPRHLSCAETAALLRAALKKAFPGVVFSVRSKTYSMGASIRVSWTGGPSSKSVGAITSQFAGSGFDGMIDMKYNVDRWLLPDGTMAFASTVGTEGSAGVHPRGESPKPHPQAELVSPMADHVFVERSPADGERHLTNGTNGYGDPRTACELMMPEVFTSRDAAEVNCADCTKVIKADEARFGLDKPF